MTEVCYAIHGEASGSPLTYGGRVITHNNREEMEFLFPGARVVEIGSLIPPQDRIALSEHPDMAAVSFPLRREDFR
jgi:hypothetical protein